MRNCSYSLQSGTGCSSKLWPPTPASDAKQPQQPTMCPRRTRQPLSHLNSSSDGSFSFMWHGVSSGNCVPNTPFLLPTDSWMGTCWHKSLGMTGSLRDCIDIFGLFSILKEIDISPLPSAFSHSSATSETTSSFTFARAFGPSMTFYARIAADSASLSFALAFRETRCSYFICHQMMALSRKNIAHFRCAFSDKIHCYLVLHSVNS